MTIPLVIAGAGGFARETAELVRDINARTNTFHLIGFLDDDPDTHGSIRVGWPVVGSLEWILDRPHVSIVMCLGTSATLGLRLTAVDRLGLGDERYPVLRHPTATIARSVTVGPGTVIHAGTVCTADASIGRHVEIMPSVVITHDDVIEDGVTMGAGVRLGGSVHIGRGAYLGSGALIREGLTIGSGAVVGMGSVVTRSIPPHEVWFGQPARCRRRVAERERADRLSLGVGSTR